MSAAVLVLADLMAQSAFEILASGVWQGFIAAKSMTSIFQLDKSIAFALDFRASVRAVQVTLSVEPLTQKELAIGVVFRRALFRFIISMLGFGMLALAAHWPSSE